MPLLAANDRGVIAASIASPIAGAWHADLTVDAADVSLLTGQVKLVIADGALTLVGTAKKLGVYLDTARVRLVAGGAGLAKLATPRHYTSTTVRIVLADLLSAGGERLSATADAGVLGQVLASWMVTRMAVGRAIALLMAQAGASWRLLADGTVWCGHESWPDSGLSYTLEHQDSAHNQLEISSEAPLLLAGRSLDGVKVNYVEHHVDHASVKSTVWPDDGGGDRQLGAFQQLVRGALPNLDYLALYRAVVVKQSNDLRSVDVVPDDPRLGAMSAALLRHGLPGITATIVPPGPAALVGFMNGDPSKPYVHAWEGNETGVLITLAGDFALQHQLALAAGPVPIAVSPGVGLGTVGIAASFIGGHDSNFQISLQAGTAAGPPTAPGLVATVTLERAYAHGVPQITQAPSGGVLTGFDAAAVPGPGFGGAIVGNTLSIYTGVKLAQGGVYPLNISLGGY